MKKRKMVIWIVAVILVITISLVAAGMLFGKSEEEKRNGLSGHFDVSKHGAIAYVHYTDGQPQLRLYRPEQTVDTNVLQLETDKVILDPTFSNDGTTITYILQNKAVEEELTSSVHQINLETKQDKELFSAPSLITEIEFSPDENSLFYLMAGIFKNYSPIASKRPHDFDVHEYTFAENKQIQHTEFKEYDMSSLNMAADGKSVFVRMGDVAESTPEDSFDVTERIFEIPLDHSNQRHVVSDPADKVGIYGFTLVPNSKEVILQSIANFDKSETYQYELYKYHLQTKEKAQLTSLKEYAGNPKINQELNKIYFTVDLKFAQRNSDYRIYEMNLDGTEIAEIPLLIQE